MTALEQLNAELTRTGLTRKVWYNEVYLLSSHWKALKKAKYAEAGRKCQRCSAHKRLEIHHNAYRSFFDVLTSDLEVLCGPCHRKHHGITDEPAPKKKKPAPQVQMIHSDPREAWRTNGPKKRRKRTRKQKVVPQPSAVPTREESALRMLVEEARSARIDAQKEAKRRVAIIRQGENSPAKIAARIKAISDILKRQKRRFIP